MPENVAEGSTPTLGRSYKPSKVITAVSQSARPVPRMAEDSMDGVVTRPRASKTQGWIKNASKVEYE